MKKLWTRPKQMQGSVGEDSDRTDDEPLVIDAEGNITESENNKQSVVKQTQNSAKEDSIATEFDALKKILEHRVGLHTSFDVVFREMVFGGKKQGYFIITVLPRITCLRWCWTVCLRRSMLVIMPRM